MAAFSVNLVLNSDAITTNRSPPENGIAQSHSRAGMISGVDIAPDARIGIRITKLHSRSFQATESTAPVERTTCTGCCEDVEPGFVSAPVRLPQPVYK
jgi:hypothetical protein